MVKLVMPACTEMTPRWIRHFTRPSNLNMLQILNKTPFEVALALFTDMNGAEKVSVAVKGTFIIPQHNRAVQVADEQIPVFYANEYFDEPTKSSIKYPVDVVLEKINTDIILIGHAYSTDGRPVRRLPVSMKVGKFKKTVLVTGDRKWIKNSFLPGFSISKPKAFNKMALRYEYAFGGVDKVDKKNIDKFDWDQRNPIGTGFRINKKTVENNKLPNLEDPENLISHWKQKPPVACFGAIDSFWQPRLKHIGSYNEEWLNKQFPILPIDFDMTFFNTAHPDLIAKGFLKGGQEIILTNLSKRGALAFNLPNLEISLMFRLGETRNYQKADLWTVLFEPDSDHFYMVWGCSFSVGKTPSRMRYVKVEMNGAEKMMKP